MQKELNVCHLYGNLLNTYGDNGNLLVLRWLAKKNGVTFNSEIISLGDDFNPEKYNLVFIGGGQDYEQLIVSKDIQNKHSSIKKYIENSGVMLAVCGGFQLLGEYYIGAKGERIPGICALPHHTETQHTKRFIGEITIENEAYGETYHGFENHNGLTFLGDGMQPLGKVIAGNGNNGQDGAEGAIYKNTFCTYLHGPVLARSLNLAQRIFNLALEN